MSESKKPWEVPGTSVTPKSAFELPTAKPAPDTFQAPTAAPEASGSANVLDTIAKWKEAKDELDRWKEEELRLRLIIDRTLFPSPKSGANTAKLSPLLKVTSTHPVTYKVDEAALPSVLEKLPEGSNETLFRYKPELNLKEFKTLDNKYKLIVSEAVTSKEGTPQLKVVETPQKA